MSMPRNAYSAHEGLTKYRFQYTALWDHPEAASGASAPSYRAGTCCAAHLVVWLTCLIAPRSGHRRFRADGTNTIRGHTNLFTISWLKRGVEGSARAQQTVPQSRRHSSGVPVQLPATHCVDTRERDLSVSSSKRRVNLLAATCHPREPRRLDSCMSVCMWCRPQWCLGTLTQ